ncbi:unnamed protein product [Rotaria sp. Silwood1]|nr:unnamed protein product [Rotaria sp. Silwood1]CAF4577055.1 unnamed protein product [Rotaria sp. Silwood1]
MSLIGKIGKTGTNRPAHSPDEKKAFELAASWMHEAGMTTRIDNFGNLIGHLEGKDSSLPVLMMGSHLDSQPYGGRFDGVAGVLCAIEVATTLKENNITPNRSIEIISFADEEGWRFNKGLFGSKGILGKLEDGDLQRKDKDGITREQALKDFGCDITKFKEDEYKSGSIFCFLELHIEQGPVLDVANKPIAVVSGISGPLWWTLKLKGMAGHAGSVPMHLRKDAMLGAAEIIVALNQIATQVPNAPTVGTVGTLNVFPASRNIIAEEITMTIDLRDIDLERRNKYEQQLRNKINEIAKKHQLAYEISEDTNSEPRYCADWIKEIIHNQCKALNLDAPEIMSGPFHDSLPMSYATDYGMIFIRSRDGISHNPLEYSSYEDLALGTNVLLGTVLEILKNIQLFNFTFDYNFMSKHFIQRDISWLSFNARVLQEAADTSVPLPLRIRFLDEKQLTKEQQLFVKKYFDEQVRSNVIPLMIEGLQQMPYLRDKSIYLAVTMHKKQSAYKHKYALIEVPAKANGRFILLPSKQGEKHIILLEDIIRFNLPYIFSYFGFDDFDAWIFKVTKDAEIDIDNDVTTTFVEKMEKGLKNRRKGKPVRFAYDKEMDSGLLEYLITRLSLNKKSNIIPGGRIHNFRHFMDFPNVFKATANKRFTLPHSLLENNIRVTEVVQKQDLMLHFPYHSFNPIIDMLREAAMDETVVSIKITAYRLAENSKVINALINAARNGKDVVVMLELKARFDEEANLEWKEILEQEGVKVLLGVPRMKIHAKLCIIKKREKNKTIQYGFVSTGNLNENTIIIPVVVHIVSYFPDAISDATIINKIKQMEDGFAKRGAFDSSRGVDTKIRFCLAHRDPDGGVTSGITREKSFFTSYLNPYIEDHRLKNLNQWNPDEYCNIWYINSMEYVLEGPFACGEWSTGKAIAYATLPAGGPLDGIVVPEMAATDVWCHEMGHYLGLYHTFSRDCKNNDCQIDGDRVCDTPPDRSVAQSGSCKNMENSCRTDSLSGFLHDTTDFNDNFMDYGRTCIGMFTNGQKDRMINSTFAFRSGLLNPKCDYPCTSNAVAYFTKSIAYPVAGDFVTFNNQSTNATAYKWYFNDVLVGTGASFSYTFTNQGKFKVALHAYANAGDSCFSSYIGYVIVNCGVTARFYSLNVTIGSLLPDFPDSITFINTSVGATSFEWYYYGPNSSTPVFMSNQKNITYIFPDTGAYFVYLIARNGPCADTTSYQPISVLDPIPDGIAYPINMHCYRDSGLQFGVRVCNSGYARIKKRIPISFYEFNPSLPNANLLGTYYTDSTVPGVCCADFPVQTLWYNHTKYKSLYVVFNDSGHIVTPFVMNKKNTFLIESNYANNVTSATNEYNIAPNPASITNLVPYDVVTIRCYANENTLDKNFTWSPALNLSCTRCQPTDLTIDSNRIKRVIAVSEWGCRDTDFVKITVPPHNDLKATVQRAECYYKDSIDIDFKITNKFKKGKILKNTTVAFYTSNPTLPGAMLMPPIFTVAQFVNDTIKRCNIKVKNIPTTKIWSVINDTNLGTPVQLPSTCICEGTSLWGYSNAGTYIDTLVNVNGCDSVRTLNLSIRPRSYFGITDTICAGDTLMGRYKTGVYFDTLVAVNGCDSIVTLNLLVNPLPKPKLGFDKELCYTESLRLYGGKFGEYLWNNGSTDSAIIIDRPGTYWLMAINQYNCIAFDTVNVYPIFCHNPHIPNVFSPNGDAINDTWLHHQ